MAAARLGSARGAAGEGERRWGGPGEVACRPGHGGPGRRRGGSARGGPVPGRARRAAGAAAGGAELGQAGGVAVGVGGGAQPPAPQAQRAARPAATCAAGEARLRHGGPVSRRRQGPEASQPCPAALHGRRAAGTRPGAAAPSPSQLPWLLPLGAPFSPGASWAHGPVPELRSRPRSGFVYPTALGCEGLGYLVWR